MTRQWWDQERPQFEVWISDHTIMEVNSGNYPRKAEVLNLITQLPVLPFEERIAEITQVYMDNYVMPRVLEGDARHLAYASFHRIDFLLTWNGNHLANTNKQQHIRILNTRLRLHIPDIVTPLTLITENIP